jgi:hypothetical protein
MFTNYTIVSNIIVTKYIILIILHELLYKKLVTNILKLIAYYASAITII